MKKKLVKIMLVMGVSFSFGNLALAGCNPCICGQGGGLPPPPDCPKQSVVTPVSTVISLINKK